MPEVRFYLKDSSSRNKTLIYLVSNFRNKRLKYSTGQRIQPNLWDRKEQKAITKKSHPQLKEYGVNITYPEINRNKAINNELGRYKEQFDLIYDNLIFNKEIPTPEKIRKKMDEEFREQEESTQKEINLNQYFENFINELEAGKRLTSKGEKYKHSSIKSFKDTKNQFDSFQKKKNRKYDFDQITIDFYDEFVRYFTNKNCSTNYIGKHVKNLKTIMRFSRDEGLHNNTETERKKFKTLKTDVKNIYLTESEIRTLFELDLSKKDKTHLDIARDVFLIGCYTALRYSDYSRIKKEYIQEKDGKKFIDMITQKTGERVIIPVRWELDEILKKYDYNVPKTHEQKVNKYIKEVGEIAEINDNIEIETTKGGLKVNTVVPKHDLIKTHTARRSGATNMYLAGIPSIDIMKITGHKKESSFLKYICVTKEQTASNLANHEYFNAKKIKVV